MAGGGKFVCEPTPFSFVLNVGWRCQYLEDCEDRANLLATMNQVCLRPSCTSFLQTLSVGADILYPFKILLRLNLSVPMSDPLSQDPPRWFSCQVHVYMC
jgi:hypothetical protein